MVVSNIFTGFRLVSWVQGESQVSRYHFQTQKMMKQCYNCVNKLTVTLSLCCFSWIYAIVIWFARLLLITEICENKGLLICLKSLERGLLVLLQNYLVLITRDALLLTHPHSSHTLQESFLRRGDKSARIVQSSTCRFSFIICSVRFQLHLVFSPAKRL